MTHRPLLETGLFSSQNAYIEAPYSEVWQNVTALRQAFKEMIKL